MREKKVETYLLKGAIAKAGMGPIEFGVLYNLLDYINEKEETSLGRSISWPAQETIAKNLGCSVRSVIRCILKFEKLKLITIETRTVTGYQVYRKMNTYTIDKSMILKCCGDGSLKHSIIPRGITRKRTCQVGTTIVTGCPKDSDRLSLSKTPEKHEIHEKFIVDSDRLSKPTCQVGTTIVTGCPKDSDRLSHKLEYLVRDLVRDRVREASSQGSDAPSSINTSKEKEITPSGLAKDNKLIDPFIEEVFNECKTLGLFLPEATVQATSVDTLAMFLTWPNYQVKFPQLKRYLSSPVRKEVN